MRGPIACLLLLVALATLVTAAASAQAQPRIRISPREGLPGTVISITGEGFAPGDTVYIQMFPGIGGDHGTILLETIAADAGGSFNTRAVMPPEGFENWGRIGGQYTVLAYPSSFGNQGRETVEAAPKVVFTLTPGVWPPSGVGAGVVHGERARGWALAALGLAAAFGGTAAVMMVSARRKA
jgi:hypothetical protein